MRCLKVNNGIVENVAVFQECPEGWVESPSGVGCDWSDNGDGTFSCPTVTPRVLTQKELDKKNKRIGFDYNGTMVPVTSEDANGVMQMKIAFEEMGISSMSFEMTNGEALSITLAEWPAFKTVFFGHRSSFFNAVE